MHYTHNCECESSCDHTQAHIHTLKPSPVWHLAGQLASWSTGYRNDRDTLGIKLAIDRQTVVCLAVAAAADITAAGSTRHCHRHRHESCKYILQTYVW